MSVFKFVQSLLARKHDRVKLTTKTHLLVASSIWSAQYAEHKIINFIYSCHKLTGVVLSHLLFSVYSCYKLLTGIVLSPAGPFYLCLVFAYFASLLVSPVSVSKEA